MINADKLLIIPTPYFHIQMLRSVRTCRGVSSVAIPYLCFFCTLLSIATAEDFKDWNIPEGNAIDTLKLFSNQGGTQIMFSDEAVSGVTTNSVDGNFSSTEALSTMLNGTKLEMVRSGEKPIYAIKLKNAWSEKKKESTAQFASSKKENPFFIFLTQFIQTLDPRKQQPQTKIDAGGNAYELSPFLIESSTNHIGYYAENTLAGSRLNSKVSDLAASISIVSQQQMEDTASVDINEILLYEANVEGTKNFTRYTIDKDGAVTDYIAGFSNGSEASGPFDSNRMRGIGQAKIARNYFPSISRIPFDSYNTSTVEINRGPNSILFGLGNAAGIINQSLKTALIGDNSAQLKLRIGSWDARRAMLSFNQTIIPDKLAVLIASVHDEKGFQRQPAHDISDRIYFNLNYRPTSTTTLQFYFEAYHNDNRRPNTITPRDLVTPWREAGSPSWNPVDRTVTLDGVSSGPFDTDAALPAQLWPESNRPLYYFENGQAQLFTQRNLSSDPTLVSGNSIYRTMVSGYDQKGPLWIAKGITDNTIYDWEKINIVATNNGEDRADTIGFELNQKLFPKLFLNIGWHKEQFKSSNSYYISQQTGATIQVDPNTHLLDGSKNPFYGKPFIEIREPDDFDQWENNGTLRTALAYELDFTQSGNATQYLGKHRIMGLWSRQTQNGGFHRWRQVVTSEHDWIIPSNLTKGSGGAIYRRIYLGDNNGNVNVAPEIPTNRDFSFPLYRAYPIPGTTDLSPISHWQWDQEAVDSARVLHMASSNDQQITDTRSLVIQNYLLNNRIISTLGWRNDRNKARTTELFAIDPDTGLVDPNSSDISWLHWRKASGSTSSMGIVAKPTDWLFFHYNKSDNFQLSAVSFDIRDGKYLRNPKGKGIDYGLMVESKNGRFYARANWFTTRQTDSRVDSQFWRMGYFDAEAFYDWANLAARYEGLSGKEADDYVDRMLQLPENFMNYRHFVGGTSDLISKGFELNLIYNPKRNWNLKLNLSRQHTLYENLLPEYAPWREARLQVWKNAHSDAMPIGYQDFWTYNNLTATDTIRHIGLLGGSSSATPQDWFTVNVENQMTLVQNLNGKAVPTQREWRWNLISNYVFTDGVLKNVGIGGSIRGEDEALIGYLGGAPDPDGILRSLDENKPVYSEALYHVDLWLSYKTTIFRDKVGLKLQLNIRDAFENGGLQPIRVNPDGSPSVFRIIDARQFFLSAAFEF